MRLVDLVGPIVRVGAPHSEVKDLIAASIFEKYPISEISDPICNENYHNWSLT